MIDEDPRSGLSDRRQTRELWDPVMEIIIDNLVQVFGDPPDTVLAIDRITHRFPSQRVSCILGPSGCGKSTMIQVIDGTETCTSGTVTISGQNAPNLHSCYVIHCYLVRRVLSRVR